MNFKFLIPLGVIVILAGLVFFYNPKSTENERINTNIMVTESRLKGNSENAPEILTDSLTDLKTETILETEFNDAPIAQDGSTVRVSYRGWRANDGYLFDQSFTRGDEGFTFTIGSGVIDGWSKGVVGMKVGEIRRLKIPSSLGYADTGAGEEIPPNTDLIFDIELLEIVSN